MPGEYKFKPWTSRRTRPRLIALLCVVTLTLASVTWAARSTSPTLTTRASLSTAQPQACTPTEATAAASPAVQRPAAGDASARTEQTLAVVVEPPECPSSSPPIPAPHAAQGVLGNHAERLVGPHVALTLQVSPNQETTCEIVLRDYRHLKHPLHTRTRYCHSNVRRGHWQANGPAKNLPRWAILTGSARLIRMEVHLSALTSVTQPIGHATVYLSSSLTSQRKPVKITTNSKGVASLLIPYGPTRVLTATYRGEGGYEATSTQAEVQFQARSSDLASTRLIAPGAPVTFHGVLGAGPLPKGHTPAAKILIQYRSHNRWVTWGTTPTHASKWHITLALIAPPQALTTRAVVMPSKKYPYIEGTSRIVHLYITHQPPA